jgi:hypothetical protein
MTETKPHDDHGSEITAIDMSTPSSSNQTGSGVPKPEGDIVQNEKMGRPGDRDDGNHILQQSEVMDKLPYTWTPRKKWTVLSVIFVVQCSMNCRSTLLDRLRVLMNSQRIDLCKRCRLLDGKVQYIRSSRTSRTNDLLDLLRFRM